MTNLFANGRPKTLLLHTNLLISDKITIRRLSLASNHTTSSAHLPSHSSTPPDFSTITPTAESEIHKILSNCPTSNLILIQSHLASQRMCMCPRPHSRINIVISSLTSSHFHPILKEYVIPQLLKKFILDKYQLSNYRPNLSLISKMILVRVVKSRLTDHLTSKLLNPHQSAKYHSTETAVYSRSSHQCDRITKVIMSMSPRPFCSL